MHGILKLRELVVRPCGHSDSLETSAVPKGMIVSLSLRTTG